MSMTSDEVNFLVYRYLQESGFVHSAFTFAYESQVAKSNVISAEIPPGALISFVQKGLQYVGIEAHVNEDGTERDCDGDLSLLSPHICHIAQSGTRGVGFPSSAVSNAGAKRKRTTSDVVTTTTSPTNNNNHNNDGDGGSVPFNVHPSKNITLLRGHTAEVFTCSWSPKERSVLVSSSGDSTARIWNVANVEKNNMPIILHHMKDSDPSKPPSSGGDDHLKNSTNLSQYKRDVTTIKWNTNGTHVASGSYDGVGRIWTQAGALVQTLRRHQGPIFSMKWNPSSTYLLSGSYDKSVIVWNAETGEMKQHFQCHAAPALDVDWRDDETFASCSTDKTIHLCRIGTPGPVMTFVGHQDEVNTIKWNPAKTLLASCSDDHTARVWSPDSSSCIQNFSEHDKEIYIIQWNPSGTTLATASFDATVRLWDIETGKRTHLFSHEHSVYSLAFSPNGEYLATGSLLGQMNIWSIARRAVVQTYTGQGDVYEVDWNVEGNMLAACFSDGHVCVMNVQT